MDKLTYYQTHGFYIERQVLSADECDRIISKGMALIEGADVPNRIMQPHQSQTIFMDYLTDDRIVDTIECFAGEEAIGTQTMFYIKPPGSTGHGWHQDNFYITGDPKPCLAAWCALGAIGASNGGLTVYPGSHQSRTHYPMVDHNDVNFGNHAKIIEPPEAFEPMLVELEQGDVLYFDGYLIHGSFPNISSDDSRPAFISHYLPEQSVLPNSKGDRVRLHAVA